MKSFLLMILVFLLGCVTGRMGKVEHLEATAVTPLQFQAHLPELRSAYSVYVLLNP